MCDLYSQKNQEWTISRLKRLKHMLETGSPKSLILESFICDDYYLKIGIQMLDWRKKELNGTSNSKYSEHCTRGD